MKLKATTTINLGVYMDIRPEIEIEVPDGLQGPELVKWLHKEYGGLLDGWKDEKPKKKVSRQDVADAKGWDTPATVDNVLGPDGQYQRGEKVDWDK